MDGVRAVDMTGGRAVEAPITPEWIVEGAPVARIHEWSISSDLLSTTAVWSCTAGSFRWFSASEEMVHILEGSVTVADESGHVLVLTPGTAAVLTAGQWTTWTIDDYVLKHAVWQFPVPAPVRLFWRVLSQTRRLARGTIATVTRRSNPASEPDPTPLVTKAAA